eukprot:CAMPEP_0178897972 /NCGR_PEP_ID=MMETSP0786-20121207/2062_1 /TAXON_ID=186022 /ORGANISM="Thalassionema frauenfeldii, Strain CCMP 1798" /LENGTH=528 /DNA_ID=CAMNT_0020568619 /DNA_START=108 /DNA_END=1694 /DNA_ORIENTATION=-
MTYSLAAPSHFPSERPRSPVQNEDGTTAPLSTLELIQDKLNSFAERNTPTETPPSTPPPTISPSSILDIMVARYIQYGIEIRPPPTASPYPSMSPSPTSSRAPTTSDYPTTFPTLSKSSSPTISPSMPPKISNLASEPSTSPTTVSSIYLAASKTDPPSNVKPQNLANMNTQDKPDTTQGYGRGCPNFEIYPESTHVEIVFTYLAESTMISPSFITNLEKLLLDHGASEALQCSPTSDYPFSIYEIKYPENKSASEIVTCEPSHSESDSCWIMRTTMVVTTDQAFKTTAKLLVLSELKDKLNDGTTLTRNFPDIVFSQYLGPDLMDTFIPQVKGEEHGIQSQSSIPFTPYAFIAAGACAFFILILICWCVCKRRRQASRRGSKLTSNGDVSDGYSSDSDSVEIKELLAKSRKRLQSYKDNPIQESSDSENSNSEENSMCSTEYRMSTKNEESSERDMEIESRSSKSAASRNYKKTRVLSSSENAPDKERSRSKKKNNKKKLQQNQDIERCDAPREGLKSSKSSRRGNK